MNRTADVLLTIIKCLFIIPLIFALELSGIINISQPCRVNIISRENGITYQYLPKTADTRQCGIISVDYTDNSVFGGAFPTQWWNMSMASGKDYPTLLAARTAIEKLCKPDSHAIEEIIYNGIYQGR
jgi:hypothetical protein